MSNAPLATVLIMAGGTGGHVYPALATALQLRSQGARVEWLGTSNGIEAEVVPAAGITIHFLTAVGVRGKKLLQLVLAPFRLANAVLQAWRVMRAIKPTAVLGMGGFAAAPGGVVAWCLRTPLIIHEQNAIAGTTNRLLAGFATRVLTAFPNVLPRGEHVGNPVRSPIAELITTERKPVAGRRLHLLVVGGSLGAAALNALLPEALATLSVAERPEVWHQTGKAHIESALARYNTHQVEATVVPYIDDMAHAYAWADLVVCRSGAMTVSELTCAGLPSLLIPFPHAIDDHQTANAQWLVDSGAACLLPQAGLNAKALAAVLKNLLDQPAVLSAMANAARALAMPHAAQRVADICLGSSNGHG